MASIVIIGGGLAGLTVATRVSPEHPVIILEAAARLGGQIHTELDHGFVVERGGEGFVARSEAVPALARDLGLPAAELIDQATLRSYGYDGAQLHELRPGEAATLLGFQVPQAELGRGIRSMRRGMGSLIAALVGNLDGRTTLELGTRAVSIDARDSALAVRSADGRAFDASAVVVATSAAAASTLLADLAGEPARALARAPVQSSVTVELAYPRDAIAHPLDGSGFVVAQDAQEHGLRACAFTSSKFQDRAPPGQVSLRLFFRPSAEALATLDDDAWIERARSGLARVLAVRAQPLRAWVSRWPDALPVFDAAHRSAVAALERELATRRVLLTGAAFHGSGIDAALQSAERTAARLLAELAPR